MIRRRAGRGNDGENSVNHMFSLKCALSNKNFTGATGYIAAIVVERASFHKIYRQLIDNVVERGLPVANKPVRASRPDYIYLSAIKILFTGNANSFVTGTTAQREHSGEKAKRMLIYNR